MEIDKWKIVLDKCAIKLEGKLISKELIMKKYSEFISNMISSDGHAVGIVLHTGSICFDAILFVCSAIASLFECKTDINELVNNLEQGEYVIYGNNKRKRYIFEGIDTGKNYGINSDDMMYVKLRESKEGTKYIHEIQWGRIEPYNGDSKNLGGRGIRKKDIKRSHFFEEVLGYEGKRIPSVVDTSSVIVCSREKADFLFNNITITFNDCEIPLLDLVTGTYYTEENEFPYRGNNGKNEPVIKVTSKVSIARRLVKNRNGNRHIGITILGEEQLKRGYLELPELISRKSLQYVFLCTRNGIIDKTIFPDNDEYKTFACTKDFLLENITPQIFFENQYTTALQKQIDMIIDKNIVPIRIESAPITIDNYKEFKKILESMRKDDYEAREKSDFIRQAYSLMSLFLTIVFPIEEIKKSNDLKLIDIATPEEKIDKLKAITKDFPTYFSKKTKRVIELLISVNSYLEVENLKEKWMREHLLKTRKKSTAIIVQKAYYIKMIERSYQDDMLKNTIITTPNKFDEDKSYDDIIVIGNIEGSKFNIFTNNSAAEIFVLLYECEISKYKQCERAAKYYLDIINTHSYYKIKGDTQFDENEFETDEEMEVLDKNLNDYISNTDVIIDSDIVSNQYSRGISATAEIAAVLFFSDDKKAYITKRYKGYILDQNTGVVSEKGLMEFCEGDSLIFTNHSDNTMDVVDSVLDKLINEGVLNSYKDDYQKSKLWKNELNKYKCKNNLSSRELAEHMNKRGSIVQEATIIGWLDEDSHTVGPRNLQSLVQIGELTDNYELKNHSEVIFEACRKIRSIRIKILNEIGEAIIDKYRKNSLVKEKKFELIYNQIDSLAEVLQIEKIVLINRTIPWNMANRPID